MKTIPIVGPFENFLFPRICMICGNEQEYLCSQCVEKAKKPELKCYRCNRRNPLGSYCASCTKPFLPDRIFGAFYYEGRLKEIIHQYKYEDAFALSGDLAKAITPVIRRIKNYHKYHLGYIPLSRVKMLSRGYNQAELLAEELSDALDLGVVDLIDRLVREDTQVISKTKRGRKRNVRGIFKIKQSVSIPKHIILIDDVVTTGATVEEATKVLKRAGVKSVIVVALAMA